MKPNFAYKLFFLLSLFIVNMLSAVAQDLCTPIGWATQNGGTTGGGSATPITVSTIADLQVQANSTGAKVIYVSGVLGAGVSTRVVVAANKTIIGLPGATLNGGFDVKTSNVIIRNMKIKGPGSVDVNGVDCITIDGATNVWIDHCDIYDGQDGNMDIVNGANYVAVTWCKFYYTSASANHQFCNLLGNSDTKTTDRGKLKITMMYNWWGTGVVERMPRVRFGQVHVVNNYFNSRQASYCVRAGIEADILVESNYFDSTSTPIDLYQNNFTAVTSRNNYYVATSGNNAGSGVSFTPPYALTITPAANLKSIITNSSCGAGATMASPTSCGCGSTPITYYTLATSSLPAAGGSVTGAGTYASGNTATLTATPAAGYVFTGWSGDATGTTATVNVLMNGNKNVTANFQAVTTYTLTTSVTPAASGTVSGAGTYQAGATATITATPAAGYSFVGWSGSSTATTPTITIVMNANASVIATFKANAVTNYTLTTGVNPAAAGTVTGAGTYASGTVVTLTATPATGYTFTGWSGASTSTSATTTVTMTGNLSVTANFTASSGGSGTIRIEDSNTPTTGLCSYEGVISSNSGANNGKVINLTNSTAKGINWKIVTPSAGAYTFKWRYVNSSSNNVFTMKLIVNGVVINTALGFPKTTSSTVFANTTATLNLLAGSNIIRIESINGTATADIDWLEVTGLSPAAGNCTVAKSANINAPMFSGDVKLFPNPVKNKSSLLQFSLVEPQLVKISIADAQGITRFSINKTYVESQVSEQIDASSLKPGVYYISIIGEKNVGVIKKWIVM